MSTPMRAKFSVSSVDRVVGADGTVSAERVKFSAVSKSGSYPADGSDENNTFAKWTPSASCDVYITNPELHGKYAPGQTFYVDFTPV